MVSSRIPGLHRLDRTERIRRLRDEGWLSDDEATSLANGATLDTALADKIIENALGVYGLPLGVATNFRVNGRDYLIPMAIEEPSVVASSSHAARIVRAAGGFAATSTGRLMVGQVQLLDVQDAEAAEHALRHHAEDLIELANSLHPAMVQRGGGARGIEVHHVGAEGGQAMLVLHLLVDTRDAMGANTINTMVEAIAPAAESLSGGRACLRILSNYTDNCLARASCAIRPDLLTTGEYDGREVMDGIIEAARLAECDMHRAVTHNKGVMNGVDAVLIATGNDWRAIEAAAHAYASRHGRYGSMTTWRKDEEGNLVGTLELPMPVGIVGGSIGLNPGTRVAHALLDAASAEELAQVIVAVGLAQNLAALKALVTHGIQRGHMALQARSVALMAGASPEEVDRVAQELVKSGDIAVRRARELLAGPA